MITLCGDGAPSTSTPPAGNNWRGGAVFGPSFRIYTHYDESKTEYRMWAPRVVSDAGKVTGNVVSEQWHVLEQVPVSSGDATYYYLWIEMDVSGDKLELNCSLKSFKEESAARQAYYAAHKTVKMILIGSLRAGPSDANGVPSVTITQNFVGCVFLNFGPIPDRLSGSTKSMMFYEDSDGQMNVGISDTCLNTLGDLGTGLGGGGALIPAIDTWDDNRIVYMPLGVIPTGQKGSKGEDGSDADSGDCYCHPDCDGECEELGEAQKRAKATQKRLSDLVEDCISTYAELQAMVDGIDVSEIEDTLDENDQRITNLGG